MSESLQTSTAPGSGTPAAASREPSGIRSQLQQIVTHLLGVDVKEIDEHATFLELGADSLLLMQITQSLLRKLGVKIPFRSLLEELPTPAALADHLERLLPAAAPETVEPAPAAPVAAAPLVPTALPVASPPAPIPLQPIQSMAPAAPGTLAAAPRNGNGEGHGGALAAILDQQLQIMNQQLRVTSEQLALLSQAQWGRAAAPAVAETPKTVAARAPAPPPVQKAEPAAAETQTGTIRAADGRLRPAPFVAYRPAQTKPSSDMTGQQRTHLGELVARLERKSGGSKRLTQQFRRVLADNRASVAFRLPLKELLYPIFMDRAAGSRIWDIDGNEYIDVTLGFGALILGHSPALVIDALRRQSERGLGLGLEPPLAGEAAQLICELTGNERATFINDGTEAVKSAVRLARTRTGRTKIAMFQGGYHGWFDEVMAISRRGADGRPVTLPMAPGVSPHVSDNVLVLDYCTRESIEILEGCAHELAAVVVDPQQTRRPGLFDTRDFLHDIRRVTAAAGTAMVMDEVVTGFRVHPGGAQALYGIRADLVAYGKAVGAGLPIGVISGKAEYMDGIDGGVWSFGDGSYPQADQTFIQGSYFKHPLFIPAVWEVLNHYQQTGPRLQEELTERMVWMTAELKEHFEREELPIQVLQWGSICHFVFGPEVKYPSLFYYHLLDHEVYVRDARPWFLSTAHTERDVKQLIASVKAAAGDMREGGFLPRSSGEAAVVRPVRAVLPSSPERDAPVVVARSATAGEPAPDVEEDLRLPLTESQKALWIATQMGRDASRAYHMSLAWRLRGAFDRAAYERALQRVVDRHEALRSVFDADGELQRFCARMPFTVTTADLGGLPGERREAQVGALVRALSQTPFDLGCGPLGRCALLRLDREEHVAVLVLHHLIVDGWSFGVVLGELSRCYEAELRRESCELPPVVPFSDWVREQTAADRLEADEAWWLERFAGPLPVFEPPTDHPRPPVETFAGGRETQTLDASLTAAIQRLGSRRGCTLPMTLLAGFQALLHRLTGQSDLVVGVPAAGQAGVAAGSLVGYCLQILPIRSRLSGRPRVDEHLQEVRRELLAAYEHQSHPLTRLIRRLGIPRDPSRAPLVAVLFNAEPAPRLPGFGGLASELLEVPAETAQFELNLNVETGRELRLGLEYRSDLFDRATIRRWLRAFGTLFASMARDPETPLSALPLLGEAERQQVLVEWNDTASGYPRESGLHELFAAEAGRTPDAVAVVEDGRQWTYAELDRRADRLAGRLRRLGVGPEALVGICLERSCEQLAALLGVLKAGGAYLPLDPSYPEERLAFMLEDSRAPWVLTLERQRPLLAGFAGTILCLDGADEDTGEEPAAGAPARVHPEGLAYVLYTSGSTGRPKGVAINRRSLINFLSAMARRPGLDRTDVLLSVTTLSFDIAGLELYLPLLTGARLVLASREVAADGDRLLDLLASSGATVMQATPATWRLLLDAGWQGEPRIAVLCGGEALPRELAEQLAAHGSALWNLYGPTETTVWSAVGRVEPGDGPVAVGRPVANTVIRLLDEELEPVPIGVVGELYLGGDGVARGYPGRPALTAERFLPDPLAGSQGARLYRTGDRARFRPDGALEVLGRTDHQVKVRGLRIELGEVEAVLAEQPQVAAAAVAVHEVRPGDQRLIAYVVLREGAEGWNEALRAGLRRRLPEPMVPTAYVRLDTLPLAPNGKVDRPALPAAEAAAGERDGVPLLPPETGMEQAVAEVWQEVLGLETVGVDESFFDLGGHSLLLIEVRQRLRPLCDRELSLLDLFRHPSIRALAAFLESPAGAPPATAGLERFQARQAAQSLQREARRKRREARAQELPH